MWSQLKIIIILICVLAEFGSCTITEDKTGKFVYAEEGKLYFPNGEELSL